VLQKDLNVLGFNLQDTYKFQKQMENKLKSEFDPIVSQCYQHQWQSVSFSNIAETTAMQLGLFCNRCLVSIDGCFRFLFFASCRI
jgi:hypothetical protein